MDKFKRFLAFLVGMGSTLGAFSIQTSGRPISLGLVFSGLYFLFLTFDINNAKRIKPLYGSYFALPLAYLFVLWITSLFYSNNSRFYFPTTIFLNWLLMYFFLLHSCRDSKAPRYALIGVALGSVVMTVLFFMGIGIEFISTIDGERMNMFGLNPNDLCITISIGLTVLLNDGIFNNSWNLRLFRWFLLVPVIFEIIMVLMIASRTGALIIGLVLVVSILTARGLRKGTKLVVVLLGLIFIVFGTIELLKGDSIIAKRLFNTIENNDTGGRIDIWLAYLKLFPEHPIFGVGETGMMDVCRKAGLSTITLYGHETWFSPHNVLIEVLMTTGLVGLFFMLRFWIKTFKNAVRGYKQGSGTTALVLIIPMVLVILSGQILASKIAWIIYAFMIVCSSREETSTNNE